MDCSLSIVVPAYNAAHSLEACIKSIMSGQYQDFEILLVDDGSTDGTSELCDFLAKEYSKIKTFHTENRGISSARNLGIDQASGTYIGFVDADDVATPNMFAAMVDKMESDIQLVCCKFAKCRREDMSPLPFTGKYHVHVGKAIAEQILCNSYGSYVWSKLFVREVLNINQIRFKPGYIMEDQYFMMDYLRFCKRAVFLEDQLYYYIDTPNGITNSFRNRRRVEKKYIYLPRGWVYTAGAVSQYRELSNLAKARAAMTYQSVLRKIEPECDEFTAEAIAFVRKNNHLLVRYSWGIRYFISGILLCISYRLWAQLLRR